MNRTLSRTALCAAVLFSAALAACSDAPTTAAAGPDPRIEQLVAMGFDRARIVDRGDHFVVEGDIRINKRDLTGRAAPSATPAPGGPSSQRIVSTVAANRRVIRVNLAAVDAESPAWAAATRAAMNNWSATPNTNITYEEGLPADVTVSFVNDLGNCTVALGAWPVSGAPGTTVTISRRYAGSYNAAQQTWIMTHELGHNIGLGHTDSNQGTQIWGTPTWDGGSVMNSGNVYPGCPPAAPNWNWFSQFDLVALNRLYPLPNVTGASSNDAGGGVRLTWTPVPGAVSYSVQRVEERTQDDFYANTSTTTVTEESWVTGITGSSYDTGTAYTGTTHCVWSMAWQTSDASTYFYRIMAHFPRGDSPAYTSVYANDVTC